MLKICITITNTLQNSAARKSSPILEKSEQLHQINGSQSYKTLLA